MHDVAKVPTDDSPAICHGSHCNVQSIGLPFRSNDTRGEVCFLEIQGCFGYGYKLGEFGDFVDSGPHTEGRVQDFVANDW